MRLHCSKYLGTQQNIESKINNASLGGKNQKKVKTIVNIVNIKFYSDLTSEYFHMVFQASVNGPSMQVLQIQTTTIIQVTQKHLHRS